MGDHDEVINEWLATLAGPVGLPDVSIMDRRLVLDLARDAAHRDACPAAPLTISLVGLVAGPTGSATTRALEQP